MNSPAEIARMYLNVGAAKTRLTVLKMLMLSVFAGMFIAMGAFASSVASCGVQPPAVSRLLGAVVFPIGLMMVIVAGAELFTGNCLIIMPVLSRRASVLGMLYNWIIVYMGNFIGSMLVACAVVYAGSLKLYADDALLKSVITMATTKVTMPFLSAFIRGILCNAMVCTAVWVSFASKDIVGKVCTLYLPILLFVLCGFEHCVANMYFVPAGIIAAAHYGMEAQGLSWLSFLTGNLLPVTLGNIVGGTVIVGCGYWLAYLRGSTNH